jgi:glyoxylase-like metal-dependent hydrolase (beta-lactamase superfamily II)
MSEDNNLYLRQLLAGRDHALHHPVAGQMMNFAYLVGCREAGECLAVDPTWDPRGIVDIARADGMTVVGAIATHAHADHVGGTMMGLDVPGVRELLEQIDGPLHTHPLEAPRLRALTGVAEDRLALHDDGDSFSIGTLEIEVLHTPGHSPGSISLVVEGNVLTGDVLFVGACGRTDLPGADSAVMQQSLQRLAGLPGETVVLPGHHYGGAVESTIANERRTNPYLQLSADD